MPAQGRGAFLVPQSRPAAAPPKPPPKPSWGPLKSGYVPSTQPKPSVFTQALQKPAAHIEAAPQKAAQKVRNIEAQQPRFKPYTTPFGRATTQQRLAREGGGSIAKLLANLHQQTNPQARVVPRSEIQQSTLGPSEFGGSEFDLGKAIKNLGPSAVRLVVGIPQGIYQGGKAAEEAVRGKPQALGQIGKGVGQMLLHPGRLATEEPASFATLFLGGDAAVGKLAGAADVAKGMNPLERAALKSYGDIAKPREYSQSTIAKGSQQLADAFRERILRQDPNQAVGARLRRELVGGVSGKGLVKPGQIDVMHGMGEQMTRYATAQGQDFLRKVKPANGADATALYYEGYLRRPETAVADAQKRLAHLQAEHDRLPNWQKGANELQQKRVGDFLEMSPKSRRELEGTARVIGMQHQPRVNEMVNTGYLEPNQPHAAYVPFALTHGEKLGRGPLHYEQDPGVHPAVMNLRNAVAEHKSMRREVQKLQDEIKGAKKPATTIQQVRATQQGRLAEWRAGTVSGTESPAISISPKLQAAKEGLAEAAHARKTAELEVKQGLAAGAFRPGGEMYPHLQDAAGRPVTTQEIQNLWNRETNHRPIGFISHKDEPIVVRGGRGMGGGRPSSTVRSRTGEHALSGAYDNSWKAIRNQFRQADRNITGHLNENQLMSRFAIGGKHGFFHDVKDAEGYVRDWNADPKSPFPLVVRSVGPDKIVSKADMTGVSGTKLLEQFGLAEHRGVAENTPYGKWAAIPDFVNKRLDQHLEAKQGGSFRQGVQKLTEYFRHAALYTTPRWPVGVTQENAIRAVANKVSPMSLFKWSRNSPVLSGFSPKVGDAVTAEMHRIIADPEVSTPEKVLARQHVAAWNMGSMYGADLGEHLTDVLRNPDAEAKTHLEQFQSLAGPRQVLESWEKYKRVVVGKNLQAMENNARAAGVGKIAINETKGFANKWKLMVGRQDSLVKAWAKGKLEPNQAVKFTEDLFDMYGNWNHLTPAVKLARSTITPFGLWWLNSMKFVLKTLPKDHPMGTAAMTALVQGTGANKEDTSLPAWSQGNIGTTLPGVGNVNLNLLHYSPFDIAREPGEKAAEMILPQGAGVYGQLKGENPFTGKKTRAAFPTNVIRAGEGLASEATPGARIAEELIRQGGKPDESSANPVATLGPGRGIDKTLFKILFPLPTEFAKPSGGEGRKVEGRKVEGRKITGRKVTGRKIS